MFVVTGHEYDPSNSPTAYFSEAAVQEWTVQQLEKRKAVLNQHIELMRPLGEIKKASGTLDAQQQAKWDRLVKAADELLAQKLYRGRGVWAPVC